MESVCDTKPRPENPSDPWVVPGVLHEGMDEVTCNSGDDPDGHRGS